MSPIAVVFSPLTNTSDTEKKPWFKTHASDDVGGLGNSYPVAARKLAELWQKGTADPNALKPWQNAENLAGAALGKSFCSKSFGL